MEPLKINNCPSYASDYEFIVVRKYNNEYWFYGAFSNGFTADAVCSKINGVIIHNVRIQGKVKKP